jgi:hypothetical protein
MEDLLRHGVTIVEGDLIKSFEQEGKHRWRAKDILKPDGPFLIPALSRSTQSSISDRVRSSWRLISETVFLL